MNKYIKRTIKITVFFSLFLSVFLYLNSLFLNQWENEEHNIERMETILNFPDKTADVLFLGSSSLFTGVSPARIWENNKITSYNLSASAHNFFARYFKLKQILERRDLNLVVLDVSYLFNPGVVEDNDNYKLAYKQGFYSMKGIANKYEYLATLNQEFTGEKWNHILFPILKHHSNWDQLSSKKIESKVDGFKLGGLLKKDIESNEVSIIEKDREFNERELKYFKKIVELCKMNDLPILAILTPKASIFTSDIQKINKLSNEMEFDFVNFGNPDFAQEMGIDYNQDFYDYGHLNVSGNHKFSEYLGNYIETNYSNVRTWHESDNGYYEQTKIWQEAEVEYNRFYESSLLDLDSKK